MKIRRFLSIFLSLLLVMQLTSVTLAAEGDVGGWDEVEARAALLVDPETGEILYARNIHKRLAPASLTKVMTALLVLEAIEDGQLTMDTVITASETAIAGIPNDASSAGIVAGEELTVRQLLHCILVVSANEACNILAESVSGSVDAFVARMNERAKELGCEDTHFVTTNGLTHEDHYTTAWDLYLITMAAMEYDVFLDICSTKYCYVPPTNCRSSERKYSTTNHLISDVRQSKYLYSGAKGVKTGWTEAAKSCLIATAERSGRTLLTVVLGAERIYEDGKMTEDMCFAETIRLLDHGFYDFQRAVILKTDELLAEVKVELSQEQDAVKVHPAEGIECLIPSDITSDDIERTIILNAESVDAPVAKGQVMGQVILSYDGVVYGTVDLLADEDVTESRLLIFQRDMTGFLKENWPLIAGGAAALILLICILAGAARKRRRRRESGRARGSYRGRRR